MERKPKNRYLFFFTLAVAIFLFSFSIPAEASSNYKISFKNSKIEITSPNINNLIYDGSFIIEGNTELDKLYIALRGPKGELVNYPVTTSNKKFKATIWLRFGAGKYTIWAGEDASKFDGSIRFEVINSTEADNRFLTPSAYVDSDNPIVVNLANSLVKPGMTEKEKLESIHRWVTHTISYDYQLYKSGKNILTAASQTILSKAGICRDYSFVMAALSRAVGLEAKVVYGQAGGKDGWAPQLHAWNEIKVDGRWVMVDATWDAGFIKDNRFVRAPGTRYLDADKILIAKTHKITDITNH